MRAREKVRFSMELAAFGVLGRSASWGCSDSCLLAKGSMLRNEGFCPVWPTGLNVLDREKVLKILDEVVEETDVLLAIPLSVETR